MRKCIFKFLSSIKIGIFLSILTTFLFCNSQSLAATTTFSFTGSNQTFTVPAGVTSITMEGFGAAGGAGGGCTNSGGKGGYLKSTITVTANDTLTIVVGEKGSTAVGSPFGGGGEGGTGDGGGRGGSGGGATHVKNSSNVTLFVIGAGGGGGGMNGCGTGGDGGGETGADGTMGAFHQGGAGGSPVDGGIGNGGTNGASLAGGNGGDRDCAFMEGGGGGGGAGLFGGGGGGSGCMMDAGSGGGGGSSFVIAGSTDTTNTQGHASATGNGSITFTYTLPASESEEESESSGESLSNPTNDKDVIGSIDSQVSNSNNAFVQSVGMVSNRLSYLRANRNENNLSNQNLKIDFGNTMLASITNALITPISENKSKSILPNNWSSWTEGSISISKIGDTSNSSRKEIDTQSIAFGFDKKLNEGEVFGYAFQYGQSDTDIGSNGSGIDSKNYNFSLYRTKSLKNDNFIEGSIGIGKLKNDIDRKSGSNTLTGSRDGNQLFGSLNLGKTINKGDFDLTPTLGIDLGYTELDEYQEVGTNALFYDDQHIQSGMASLGLAFNNIVKFDNSSLKPFGLIEYGLDMSDSSDTRINYVSDTSTQYTYKHDVNSEHFIKSEIGFNYETKDNLLISSSYQRIQGEKHEHTDTLSFGLNFKSKRETEYAMQFGGTEDLSAGLNIAKNINGLDLNFKLDQEFNENHDKNAEISMIKKF